MRPNFDTVPALRNSELPINSFDSRFAFYYYNVILLHLFNESHWIRDLLPIISVEFAFSIRYFVVPGQ